jgi:hypothetical protein
MKEQEEKEDKQSSFVSANRRVRSFLSDHNDRKVKVGKEPIADLFPHASCFFADIAGFTAWSKSCH